MGGESERFISNLPDHVLDHDAPSTLIATMTLEELRNILPQSVDLTNRMLPAEILDTIGVLHLQMEHLQDAQSFLEELPGSQFCEDEMP